jgi:HEPN domain-containing protein
MSDPEAAEHLLRMAQKDAAALRAMLDSDTFATEIFGFHAQQAAEKALKAWLALIGTPFPRTHDLRFLLLLLEQSGADVEAYWKLVELNAFAVQFRYEAFDLSAEVVDRERVLQRVEAPLSQVEGLVGSP